MIKRLTHLRTVVFILFVVAFVPVKAQSLSAFIDATGGNLSVCQNGNYSLTASAFDGSGGYVSHECIKQVFLLVSIGFMMMQEQWPRHQ